ncbi:Xaa-Pro aminopeptidase, partial [Pancytospora epiphaga]
FNEIVDIEKVIYKSKGKGLELGLVKNNLANNKSTPLYTTSAEYMLDNKPTSGIFEWILKPGLENYLLKTNKDDLSQNAMGTSKDGSINVKLEELDGQPITGATREEKLKKVRNVLEKHSGILFTELDTIAWLFNLRGSDIKNNLVFYSYAYVTSNQAILFTNGIKAVAGVTIREYENFEEFLKSIKNDKVLVSGKCNAYIGKQLNKMESTIEIRKIQSIKTTAELYGILKGNLVDAKALLELFEWIEDSKNISEMDISKKLLEIKSKIRELSRPSFDSIVAFGTNGAELHHSPNNTTVSLENEDPATILIDSGSQYIFGTTDITRTLSLNPGKDQRKKYTMVLKAVIKAKMLTGKDLSGDNVDETARNVLKKEGIEYDSATGHGIGAGLFVHEKPPVVDGSSSKIFENQVFTIEPGYYEKGKYGVRIEDIVVAKKNNGVLEIVNLTYLPYHLKLVDRELLTEEEREYLNRYNKLTRMLLEPLIGKGKGQRYLEENTKEI